MDSAESSGVKFDAGSFSVNEELTVITTRVRTNASGGVCLGDNILGCGASSGINHFDGQTEIAEGLGELATFVLPGGKVRSAAKIARAKYLVKMSGKAGRGLKYAKGVAPDADELLSPTSRWGKAKMIIWNGIGKAFDGDP